MKPLLLQKKNVVCFSNKSVLEEKFENEMFPLHCRDNHMARECPITYIGYSHSESKILVPPEIEEYLLVESSKIIKSIRAEFLATSIEYEPNARQLVFGGSPENKRKAMIRMYEKLENMGVIFDGLVKLLLKVGKF